MQSQRNGSWSSFTWQFPRGAQNRHKHVEREAGLHARRAPNVGERVSGDGDVTEKAPLNYASIIRPLLLGVQLPPALAQQQRRLTLHSLQMLPCANGQRVWTERDGRAWDRSRASGVLTCKSISAQVQIQQQRWRRGQQNPKSVSAQSRTWRSTSSEDSEETLDAGSPG